MQIQFKQAEIVAALKQYIAAQGINTSGKSVEIAFSATRGAAGIVADVTIEDAAIPGYTDSSADDAADSKPALSVVSNASVPSAESAQAEQSAAEEAKPATPSNLFAGS